MGSTTTFGALRFELLSAATSEAAAPRLGRLSISGRRKIETPTFWAATSRGVVPHLTPDNVTNHTAITGAYFALEDFIEYRQYAAGKPPPIYMTPPPSSHQQSPLHAFTAMPSPTVTVLAARRLQRVAAGGNTPTAIKVFTSTGVQLLSTADYQAAVATLKPDIAIPLADLTETGAVPSSKRAVRMAERAEDWLKAWFADSSQQDPDSSGPATFAPVLPLPYSGQWEYLERLAEDHLPDISGLALYDMDILPSLEDYPDLLPLPRLSLETPTSPHQILRQVSLGADILVLSMLNSVSDAGIALDFTFPPREPGPDEPRILPLGTDLWAPEHRVAVKPLQAGCGCYTCTNHHRAFLHHLMQSREMVGWSLLQMHNFAVMEAFFAGMRTALAEGPTRFEELRERFSAVYETELPLGTGTRPRARGYHFKSEGGDPKINKAPWGNFKDGASPPSAEMADALETPLMPDECSSVLDRKGFAETDPKAAN